MEEMLSLGPKSSNLNPYEISDRHTTECLGTARARDRNLHKTDLLIRHGIT